MNTERILDIDNGVRDQLEVDQSVRILAKQIEERFSHLAAYHACDGRNLDGIRTDGLVPLDTERLYQEARCLFSDCDTSKIENAINRITSDYINDWYKDTVGVFVSARGSIETPWLKHPWYIWRLSSFIYDIPAECDAFLKKYMRGSNSTFVRCVFPVKWILNRVRATDDLYSLYARALIECISNGYENQCYALGIVGGVPLEFITDYIAVDPSLNG